jgi:hypothetical protein
MKARFARRAGETPAATAFNWVELSESVLPFANPVL